MCSHSVANLQLEHDSFAHDGNVRAPICFLVTSYGDGKIQHPNESLNPPPWEMLLEA